MQPPVRKTAVDQTSVVEHSDFLYNPDGTGRHAHCASIWLDSTGETLAVWYSYPDMETAGAELCLARRPGLHGSWKKAQRISLGMSASLANPVLFRRPGGDLELLFVALTGRYWDSAIVYRVRSSDDGQTWSAATKALPQKAMMVRHPPVVVGGSKLLLPAYEETSALCRTVLLSSESGTDEWREAVKLNDAGYIQPVILENSDRSLTMYYRPTDAPRKVFRSASFDGGRNWSRPMATDLDNSLSGISAFVYEDAHFLVGNIVHHGRNPLSIAMSMDKGVSWSEPLVVDDSPFEVSYPSFQVDANGMAHGLYTYNRRLIKSVSIDAASLKQKLERAVN